MLEYGLPFRHWLSDEFADPRRLERVLEEWPTEMRSKDVSTSKKRHLSDLKAMGPHTQELISELNSEQFCETLSELTGIPDLIPDPYLLGGGLHHIDPGGFLKIHADFNWHPQLLAVRKLNLLLYLNKDWQWNGGLQLCDQNLTVVKEIAPIFNRCVLFETTSTSYHGHPDPLNAPVPRKSVALYYYSKADKPAWTHSTLYAS